MWSEAGAKFFSLKPNMILARQKEGGGEEKRERRRRRRRAPETSTLKFRKNMEKVRKVKERVRDTFKRLLGNREYPHERAERENRKRGV